MEVFPDRIVVSSPGLPPKPLTIKKLLTGHYKPCSRNPIIAQSLSYFHRIEERGSGFKRMRAYMIDHGLEEPILTEDTGYFQVVFKGPGKDIKRIKIPSTIKLGTITNAEVKSLNLRQKKMVKLLLRGEELNSRRVEELFNISRETANNDFAVLLKLKIADKKGAGRSTNYVQASKR